MILIKNGTILTMEGKNYEKASILLDGSKIIAIGEDLPAPKNAKIINAEGKFVLPGFIDAHCHLGLWESSIGFEGSDGNECTDPITPEVRGIDGINPMDITFKEARELGGVTMVAAGPGSGNVIGGQFAVIKTSGIIIDEMIVKAPIAMKCAFGENPKRVYNEKKMTPMTRMGIAAKLRETLKKAVEYKEKLEFAKNDLSKKPNFDMKLEALLPVINREIPLKAHAHRVDDILTALRIAKEFNVKITLEHCTEGHLIADYISKANVPVIVGPSFGHRTKFELENKTFDTAAILVNAGVKIAIMTDSPVTPLHRLNMCASLSMKAGLSEEEALKAITINPAEILELDKDYGSISVGKEADIVVWDKHPFDLQASPDCTIIGGKVIFEK